MKREVPDGAVVKFTHRREYDDIPFVAKPQGGVTTCTLILPGGAEVFGHAQCNSKENFSKRIGRDVSLGRALKQAEQEHPELFKAKQEVEDERAIRSQ